MARTICPLLIIAHSGDLMQDDPEKRITNCLEHECTWWSQAGERCSLLALEEIQYKLTELNDMQTMFEKLNDRLGRILAYLSKKA